MSSGLPAANRKRSKYVGVASHETKERFGFMDDAVCWPRKKSCSGVGISAFDSPTVAITWKWFSSILTTTVRMSAGLPFAAAAPAAIELFTRK